MAGEGKEKRPEHINHALESRRQLRQATINFEHAALRVLFLLNGGALIAFLAFLGTDTAKELTSKGTTDFALAAWLAGLILGGFAALFGYRSQFQFYKAHGDYQRFQIGLNEYPLEEDRSDQDSLREAREWSEWAHSNRDRAHRFGFGSMLAFTAGAVIAVIGYIW